MREPSLVFHHVGVACANLEQEARKLAALGYQKQGPEFIDPVQGVRGQFLVGQSPCLELLSRLETGGVLDPWLDSGAKLYHLAYETPAMNEAIEHFRAQRAKLVVSPVGAVAFDGRKIAFLMLPNMLLVELISSV